MKALIATTLLATLCLAALLAPVSGREPRQPKRDVQLRACVHLLALAHCLLASAAHSRDIAVKMLE